MFGFALFADFLALDSLLRGSSADNWPVQMRRMLAGSSNFLMSRFLTDYLLWDHRTRFAIANFKEA